MIITISQSGAHIIHTAINEPLYTASVACVLPKAKLSKS